MKNKDMWFAVGICAGVAIGVVTHNLAMGIALGVVFGVVLREYGARKDNDKQTPQ